MKKKIEDKDCSCKAKKKLKKPLAKRAAKRPAK